MSKKTLSTISIYYLYRYNLFIGGKYYAYHRHTNDVLINYRTCYIHTDAIIDLYDNGT
nr:MAG TPA: hypothetical protein [Caudoviricetes sp.]